MPGNEIKVYQIADNVFQVELSKTKAHVLSASTEEEAIKKAKRNKKAKEKNEK